MQAKKKKVIVFFSSCNSVKYYAELLNYIDCPVLDLHGKQKQQKRTNTFFEFSNAPHGILICTDVAARGLDVSTSFPSLDEELSLTEYRFPPSTSLSSLTLRTTPATTSTAWAELPEVPMARDEVCFSSRYVPHSCVVHLVLF